MNGLTYEGTVVNGLVQLPANVSLPENQKVLVVVPSSEPLTNSRVVTPRLANPEQAVDFAMTVQEISDAGV
jgi:hypothetical protein